MSVRAAAGDRMTTCVAADGVLGYTPWRCTGMEIGKGTFWGEAEAGEDGVKAGAYSCRRSDSRFQTAASSPFTIEVRRRLPSQSEPRRACTKQDVRSQIQQARNHTKHVTRHLEHTEGLVNICQLGRVRARAYDN